MGHPSQYNLLDTLTGDFVLNAAAIDAILGGSSGVDIVETAISTVGAGTLTAAALVGGQIARTGPTGGFTDTTDTAANIVAALGGVFNAGETFVTRIKNATMYTETLAAGAGVTLPGTILVPQLSVGAYFGTVGGTAASPTVVFTHMSTVPLHAAAVIDDEQASALNTVGAGTVLAAGINAGLITRGGTQTGAFTDTTDTITNILAGVSTLSNVVGSAVEFTYVNNTTYPATLAGGTDVAVSGQTVIPANSWVRYLVTYASATSITMVALASGYFPSVGTFVANGTTPVTVANTKVTAGSIIVPTLKTVGGTVGALPAIQTITPGTGFTVAGTSLDTSTYNYEIRG